MALPLCLRIALASGAPLFAGLITGIVGGIVVASFSGSQLSVSGPAAGLTVIVLNSITDLGSYQIFLVAVVMAGIMQVILGIIKAGTIGNYFPSSVIGRMLAEMGITWILKQIPNPLGVGTNVFGNEGFFQQDQENTFSAFFKAACHLSSAPLANTILSIAVLV